MATNYNPELVTDGAVFVGDARTSSTATAGSRLYNQAGVDSTDVKLLIHGNEGSGQSFTDSSLSNHTITVNGSTTHSTTQSKFSGGSIYFDGTEDFLKVSSTSDFAFSGDFTIDLWVQRSSGGLYPYVFDFRTPAGAETFLSMYAHSADGYKLQFQYNSSIRIASGTALEVGTWYHVAVVRSGSVTTLYLNGVSQGTWSDSTSFAAAPVYFGEVSNYALASYGWLGYMDEIRITKGVALWTQDFTPPARRDTLSISDGMMYNGTCVDFDGTNDYVNIPSSSDFDLTGNFTWSFWANADNTTHQGMPIGRGAWAETGFWGIRIDSPTWELQVDWDGVTGSDYWLTSASLDAGVWTHITVTFDGTAAKIYKNGALVDSQATTTAPGSGSEPVTIGDRDGGGAPFNGKIADVRIYNVALSVNNVKEIYDDSKVIIPSNVLQTNLKGWWPLTEGAGDICYDGSGNGNNGTFENEDGDEWLTGQTGAPQLVQGYNRPMLFDGSSDYVSIADSATLSVGSTFTISYWFYPEDITTESYHVAKNTYTGNQKSYAVNQYSTGKTQFRISGDGSSHIECTGDTVMSNKAWHHIVHVFDGGAGTKLKGWVDGTAQTFNQQPSVTSAYDSTSILCLGTRDAGLAAPFAGIINEVIIYNSALDATDAAALYTTGPNGGPLPPDPRTMSYSSSTTSANIMGYWRNDNNVTLTDLSGNSNTGTAIGSPPTLLFKQGYNGSASTSTGRDGQGFPLLYPNNGAVGFNGSDNYITIDGVAPSMAGATALSIGLWAKCTDNNANQILLAINGSGLGTVILMRISCDNPTNYFDVYAGSGVIITGTSDVADGSWHYLTYVRTGTGTDQAHIYVDGVLEDSGTQVTALSSDDLWSIGQEWDAGPAASQFFNGQIANTQIYNRALSAAELKQNYNAQRSRFT